jgi:hypothetical protein
MDPKGIYFQTEKVQILHITKIVIIKIVGFTFIRKTIHITESILQVNTFLHNGKRPEITARQATLPFGSFWRAKLMTSDDLCNFLTHVTTFHDLRTTLTTNGDDILMTLKTNVEDTLTTLKTTGEDSSTTAWA